MIRKLNLVVVITAATLLLFASRARAQEQSAFARQDFSATSVVSAPGGRQMSSKIYASGSKFRTDMPGGNMHTILLLDEHKIYMVMPQMCMEMSQTMPNPFGYKGKVERERLGTATVDGHPTIIERITVTPADGGKPTVMKAWEATDLKDFPVRVEIPTAKGQETVEYKDIVLATPPASLFAVPNNCRAMPMGGGIPEMPHGER